MADIVDRATRSRMMSSIGPTDTAPELAVRRYLHAAGLRFRIHDRALPGRPDIVLPQHRAIVFVHGCFWHRHSDCRFATEPASNAKFWQGKFERNVQRDREITTALTASGWSVFVIWECQTHDVEKLDQLYWCIRGAGQHNGSPSRGTG
jgi:DNA mismatch endonuclease (patch repair protein)